MKQVREKRARGTPDASTPDIVPGNVEAASRVAARIPARSHADAAA
jgi:hypothetical protein